MSGGGGSSGPTSSTVTQTNIPEYARPYVETMLGGTQQQLFNTQQVTDPTTGAATTQISGIKPYSPFGVDSAGMGPTEQAAAESAVAGFSPLQQQAMMGIAGLQTPGAYNAALGYTQAATQGAMGAGAYQPGSFSNQYFQPGGYGAGQFYTSDIRTPYLVPYQMAQAANVAGSQVGTPMMGAAQTDYSPALQQYQMGPAQQVGTNTFVSPGSAEAYMSPYLQQSLAPQIAEAQRQAGIAGTQLAGQATQAGAFGGSRYGLQQTELQRNLGQNVANIVGQGYNTAYQQAQQQFNAEQQARLAAQQANQQAGLAVGQQNLAAQLGIQQLGAQTGLQTALANLSSQQQANVQNQAAALQAQGLNAQQALQAALANQQAGLTVGQQNLAAMLGTQQLSSGQSMQAQLANQQAQLAAQQAAEQSRQYGYGQAMTAAGQYAQYAQAAQQAAEQARQFGAQMGMQGYQTALQGANQLAGIGGQQLQARQGILGLQGQVGAQQQQQQQNIINQMIQNYAATQQYPQQQLAFMNAMIRGLPLQTATTQSYQAAPAMTSQLAGLGTAAIGGAKLLGMKKGGAVKSEGDGIDKLALNMALAGA